MLGKSLLTAVLRRSRPIVNQPAFHVPKRTWTQVGHVIVTPPRIKVTLAEKLLHFTVMYVIWFAPTAFFMTQLKVWRRLYIES